MSVPAHLATPPRRGFSLIEVMIVVAIVGILAAIAYPSYTDHVRKGRRVDAQTVLLELAQQLEQHYARNNSYATFSMSNYSTVISRVSSYYNVGFRTSAPPATADSPPKNSPQDTTGQSYILMANPFGNQANDVCKELTLTSTGVRRPDTSGCWQ